MEQEVTGKMNSDFEPQEAPTLLQCVDRLITMSLFPEQFPQLTANQVEQLRDTMEMINQAIEDVDDILWGSPEQTAGGMSMAP